jgi:hypothetical protein
LVGFVSYSGFKSRPTEHLSPQTLHVISLRSTKQMPRPYLKSDHNRFLPNTFQFIMH